MSSHIPKSPQGPGRRAAWLRQLINSVTTQRVLGIENFLKIETAEGVFFRGKPALSSGANGWRWQSPKELDPTVPVKKNFVVFVSPKNNLATVGLTDLDTATTVISTPGTWVALMDIPATAAGSYNVPQDPPPGNGVAAPSGSPLSGDLDALDTGGVNPLAKWLLIKSVC